MQDNYPARRPEPEWLPADNHHHYTPPVTRVWCGFLSSVGWVIIASLAGLGVLAVAAIWHSWATHRVKYDDFILAGFQWLFTGVITFALFLIAGLFYLIFHTKATAKESNLSTNKYQFDKSLKQDTDEYNEAVMARYNELIGLREYSLTRLTEDVLGYKNKESINKIQDILDNYE